MTLHAKPSRNGNSPDTFKAMGRALHGSVSPVQEQLVAIRAEIMHGRNYQTTDGQDADLLRVNSYLTALLAIEQLGLEIFMAGDE